MGNKGKIRSNSCNGDDMCNGNTGVIRKGSYN
jgi:hypothetical protein